MNNLISNECQNYASVLDSVTPTPHIVCNNHLSGYVTRHPRPQTNLNSPESRALEFESILGIDSNFIFLIGDKKIVD